MEPSWFRATAPIENSCISSRAKFSFALCPAAGAKLLPMLRYQPMAEESETSCIRVYQLPNASLDNVLRKYGMYLGSTEGTETTKSLLSSKATRCRS